MAVGIGVLGFAHGHVSTYCDTWLARPDLGIEIVAGWDHDDERRDVAVRKYGFAAHADVAGVLADDNIQAIVIGAETSLHAELVELAAAAGKAIVLQKPVALTISEADRIVAAVEANGVPFTMAWQMRVDPQNLQIRNLVQSGELGKLFMVRRRHSLATNLMPNFASSWHVDPALNRDIFADDASHPIDFLLWLLGEPDTVMAEISTGWDPKVPNDNGIAVFRYASGVLAEVVCSFVSSGGENTTEVTAEKGNVVQNYGDAITCSVPRSPDAPGLKWYSAETKQWTVSEIASPTSQRDRIAGLAEPLAAFLHGRRPPIATAEEARAALRMTLACYVSVREGRRVRIGDPSIELV